VRLRVSLRPCREVSGASEGLTKHADWMRAAAQTRHLKETRSEDKKMFNHRVRYNDVDNLA